MDTPLRIFGFGNEVGYLLADEITGRAEAGGSHVQGIGIEHDSKLRFLLLAFLFGWLLSRGKIIRHFGNLVGNQRPRSQGQSSYD